MEAARAQAQGLFMGANMRLTISNEMPLAISTAEHARNLVQATGDRLLVADGRVVSEYSEDLKLTSRISLPQTVSCVGGDGPYRFALCGAVAFYSDASLLNMTELEDRTWADANDCFCIADGMFWYVMQGPRATICVFDIERKTVVNRFPLDASWRGGSFSLWPGPGVVAVEAPMDCKLGLAYSGTPARFHELPNESYMLGFWGSKIVCAADSVFFRAIPNGEIVYELSGIGLPQSMAIVGGAPLFFGSDGAYRMVDASLETVELPGRNGRAIYQAMTILDKVAIVLSDGTLAICRVEGH